jgi:hypothetical protein
MKKLVAAVALAAAVSACATTPKMAWVRADGQPVDGTPQLATRFELDKTACRGEMQKADLSGSSYCRGLVGCVATGIERGNAMADVGKGCMADRGYMLRPIDPSGQPVASALPPAAAAPPSQ